MAKTVMCSMCRVLFPWSDENAIAFFTHVKFAHRNAKNFRVLCPYPECNVEYFLYDSFKRHWNKKQHGRMLFGNNTAEANVVINIPSNNMSPVASYDLQEAVKESSQQVHPHDDPYTAHESNGIALPPHREVLSVTNNVAGGFEELECWEAGILLLLRQRYYLPFDALMEVSSAIHEHYEMKLAIIQDKLSNLLEKSIVGSRPFQEAFTHIRHEEELTRYRLESSWKKHFPTVMPKAVVLNEGEPIYDWVNDKELGLIMDEVFETGYIIPFLESLQQFLSIGQVFESVMASFKNHSTQSVNCFSDVWDGSFIKSVPIFIQQKGAILGFQIYMDEVELANPLGSKKGKHKVSVFYWVLMNLPPQFRSSLRSIQLLGVVSCELLKQRGVNVFLKPFLDDLVLLNEGVSLTVRKQKSLWFGILINFAGDIPASNFVGGFKEGVGFANLPCRSCLIHRNNLDEIHLKSGCVLRDKITHESQVKSLEREDQSKAARDSLSSRYGVNGRCPFSILGYFDPTKCFMHDLMHTANEGALNLEISLCLRHLILDPVIKLDLEQVNYKISTLKSDREFTVPPPIILSEIMDPQKKLSFSSSEMSSLAMCLPIVLAEFVSSDTNPYYANLLLLFEIVSSLQCYSFSEKQLTILEKNIEIHNVNHVRLYPKVNIRIIAAADNAPVNNAITPKLHSLIHFPDQIRQFGAPRYSWCFRYESKNAPFKKIMRRNCNFRNVPWSMASHHQKLVGLDISTDGESQYFRNMNDFILQNPNSSLIDVKNAWWGNIFFETTGMQKDSKYRLIKTVTISGRTCGPGTMFLRNLPNDEKRAVFYRIAVPIVCENVIFLIMEETETHEFCPDRFSFIIRPKKSFVVVATETLTFNVPLHSISYLNEIHVIPNYYHML